jgi:hypothetical protein
MIGYEFHDGCSEEEPSDDSDDNCSDSDDSDDNCSDSDDSDDDDRPKLWK